MGDESDSARRRVGAEREGCAEYFETARATWDDCQIKRRAYDTLGSNSRRSILFRLLAKVIRRCLDFAAQAKLSLSLRSVIGGIS